MEDCCGAEPFGLGERIVVIVQVVGGVVLFPSLLVDNQNNGLDEFEVLGSQLRKV